MNRNEFLRLLVAAAGCALAGSASAQISRRPVRVGWLANGSAERPSPSLAAFREGLRELGYAEGRDVLLDVHWIEALDQADLRAASMMNGRPDVVVAVGAAVPAAHRSAGDLPVVFGYSGDPVLAGFVNSLARPGLQRTGMSWLQLELAGKRIDILKELRPGLRRVAVIANPQHPGEVEERRISLESAKRQGIAIQYLPVRSTDELDSVFASIDAAKAEAVVSFPDYFAVTQAERISEMAIRRRLPLIGGWDTQADRGHLFSYGPNLRDSARRLAYFVDRIVRGARASELPIELPSKVEFVINLKSARAIGVTIPQSLLHRADKVIE